MPKSHRKDKVSAERAKELIEASNEIDKMFHTIQVEGEDIVTTPVPDASLLVGRQLLPIEREATYIHHPYLGVKLPIKVVETDLGGVTHRERAWVKIDGLKCPKCGDAHTKPGWDLDVPAGVVNRVVQCPNCRIYIWLEAGKVQDA